MKNSESFANPGEKAYWKAGEAAWGDAWLCWYQGNRKNESGLGGWQTNKQIIGYYRNALPALFDKRGSGELIKLPPVSGYVEMQIGTGIPVYDYGKETKQSNYDQCRWLLYKEPKIEFVEMPLSLFSFSKSYIAFSALFIRLRRTTFLALWFGSVLEN